MPKSSNPLNLAVSALLAVMAMPILFIGLVGLFTAGEIWWVFGLMAAGGGLMIAGAIQNVGKWKKAVAEEEATTRAMLEAVGAPQVSRAAPGEIPAASPRAVPAAAPAGPETARNGAHEIARSAAASPGRPTEPVLAHWRYDPSEWSAYAHREATFRGREALGVGVGVAVLGTLFGGIWEGDWGGGFAVAAVIGGVIGGIRWAMAHAARASNLSTPAGEVIISPNAILLNGRYEVLQDDNFRFGGVRYVETERPPILEFTVTWATRSGRTNEQYRVPVPAGREDEARALVDTFRRIHAGVLAG
jgi:hypothetical protein